MEQTAEAQKEKFMGYETAGNKQFTGDGRVAQITVDLVLRASASATIAEEQVKGPED